jgi:signal transduction histidine kinase
MLEYESIKELMNVPMNDVYMTHRDVQKQFEQWLKSPDGIATNEIRLKTRNGKEIIVQDTYRIIFEENEDIIYFDGVLENITEKKLAEEEIHKLNNELKKLNSELEERITQRTEELETTLVELQYENDERKRTQDELYKANQKITNALEKEKELSELKTRFMSMISHEYRTPLTVILNSTYIIEKLYDGLRKLEFDDYLNKIRISIKGMTGLLEEVLLIGKSEAGKLYYTPAQLDLVPLCRSIIEETYLVDKKRHQIIFLHNSEKIVFESDEKLMKQIIGNLVSNAVKYSIENMPVTLEVIDTVDQVMINVSDKGIGISADDQKLLFDPFHRGKNIGQISGTGLGLTIVKRCADVLKATVNLQSEVNVGTTINIIIPKKK